MTDETIFNDDGTPMEHEDDRKRERLEVARSLRSLVGDLDDVFEMDDDEWEAFQPIPRRSRRL